MLSALYLLLGLCWCVQQTNIGDPVHAVVGKVIIFIIIADYLGIMKYYKTLDEKGFIMADWGKLVNDLIHNTVTPEGSTLTYNKSSFIVKDGFHPNYLCGYIASVMTYCAITGESAADIPADMFQNSAMVAALDAHLASKYNNPNADTVCKTVLITESELEKIHLLIDKYLAEKHYLNY